ncbi:MAG: asparaginase [Polyangiaceae bacterium]|jgi:L-asparaginase|nr:asparaginase [Polyangiaceae bacterium]
MTMRLLMIHTGGTLLMQPRADGAALSADAIKQDLLGELPVLKQIAEIDSLVLFRLDSADMQPEDWVEIAGVVHDKLEDYDGFVIIHGTDTMAYTASALAFLLPGLDRSVVLTGAQRPLGEIRSDGRANLVDACQVATMRIPEVAVAFNSRLFRGCRVTKLDAWGMNAFGSPSCPPLAELGLGVQVGAHVLAPRPKAPFDPRLEARVLAVRVFPGLDPKLLQGALTAGVRGMVVEAFGAGNVPRLERSLIPAIEAARSLDVPVVIVSQCPRGAVDLGAYEGGAAARDAGAIGALDMTAEAALTKLMITLGRADGGRVAAARTAFAEDWAGELTREAGGRARAV